MVQHRKVNTPANLRSFDPHSTRSSQAITGASAKASGRSLSQEVSYRLRRTFIEDDKIEAAFGGRENYLVMRMVGLAMQWGAMTFRRKSTVWMHDPGLFDVVVKSVNGVLEQFVHPRRLLRRFKK